MEKPLTPYQVDEMLEFGEEMYVVNLINDQNYDCSNYYKRTELIIASALNLVYSTKQGAKDKAKEIVSMLIED